MGVGKSNNLLFASCCVFSPHEPTLVFPLLALALFIFRNCIILRCRTSPLGVNHGYHLNGRNKKCRTIPNQYSNKSVERWAHMYIHDELLNSCKLIVVMCAPTIRFGQTLVVQRSHWFLID